jgi:hypothetical protein
MKGEEGKLGQDRPDQEGKHLKKQAKEKELLPDWGAEGVFSA